MISSHRVTPILILCIGLFRKYVAWEKGERRWRSSKKISRVNFSMIFFSLTQLNLYFCLASHEALIISQPATKRAHPKGVYQCIWNIYIILEQKYYNSTTLSMWVVYHTCVSKNPVVSKDVIFYFLW